MMVINAWNGNSVELFSRLVRQLTISFHSFLGMLTHSVGPRRDANISEHGNFSVGPAENVGSNMVL